MLNFTKYLEGHMYETIYDQSTKLCNKCFFGKFLKFGKVKFRNFVGNEFQMLAPANLIDLWVFFSLNKGTYKFSLLVNLVKRIEFDL